MNESTATRRRFLVAAMTLSGVAGGMRLSRAWAQRVDAAPLGTLAQAARRLYPHDAITDSVYAEVIDAALAGAAGDGSLANAFDAAEAALDGGQTTAFVDLDADAQVRALQAIEETPYFAAIQNAVLVGVYNHPAIWELVGYGGPSWQLGGYINRGAGIVDWLDEAD